MTTYTPTDFAYDYAIGGLPFLSAAGQKLTPYQNATLDRQTAPYRKDQTDQSAEVGEQSLQFWWLRSQSSFHAGAGQRFLDGNGDTSTTRHIRFEQSHGVDVWTPGEVSVLPSTQRLYSAGPVAWTVPAHEGILFVNLSTNKLYYQKTLAAAAPVELTGVGTGAVFGLVTDGSNYYISRADGVYKGLLSAPGNGTKILNSTVGPFLAWVKSRLIAGSLNNLYELDPAGVPTTALPAPFYSHPNADWRWEFFADGPSGFYAGGYSYAGGYGAQGNLASVYLIGLTVTTGTPVLNAPIQVLDLPLGERIQGLYTYLSKFMAVTTSLGLRVGKIQSDGTIDLGPLTLDGPSVRGATPCTISAVAGQDRFLYVLSNGTSPSYPNTMGLIRVDLSLEIDAGQYAWAADLTTGALFTTGYSACFDRYGNVAIGCAAGLYVPDATVGCTGAFLIGSRIRYSTSDPKIFERVRTEGDAPSGANGHHVTGGDGLIRTLVVDANSNYALTYGQWAPGQIFTQPGTGELYSVSSNEFRVEDAYISKVGQYVQVQMDFTESANGVPLPDIRLRGYQLKALPAQKRQRVERIPMLCYDLERDSTGGHRGELGTAYARLRALEALEEAGAIVTLQRFGPNFTSADDQQVVIDDIEFLQRDSPNKENGWGGVIHVTVRTVD